MPERAFISLGSNIEPEKHLPLAAQALREIGEVVRVSAAYQNPAIASSPQPDYLNAVALVMTDLDPPTVRDALHRIETRLGRVRTADRYAARTIDLDLCLYGELVASIAGLALPSPEICERAYLAVALAELDPNLIHPATGQALADIAARLRVGAVLVPRPDVNLAPGR